MTTLKLNIPVTDMDAFAKAVETCGFELAHTGKRYAWTGPTTNLATVLLRMLVDYTMDTPSEGDAILLNAALHLEGRHDLCGQRHDAHDEHADSRFLDEGCPNG